MKPEIEAKFLDVDHAELRAKLTVLGATCRQPMRLMRRRNFDFPDLRLDRERNGWVRVRDEGDQVTMSYKQVDNREFDGTKEINLGIDSFDEACNFLEAIGLKAKSYQETRRESWQLGDFAIELDEWPWAKPYIEFEAPDGDSLKSLAKKLGLDWSLVCHGSVEIVYQAEYSVSDKEIDSISRIVFDIEPPKVLRDHKI